MMEHRSPSISIVDRRFLILIVAVFFIACWALISPAESQDGTSPSALEKLSTEELLFAARTAVKNGHLTGAETLYQALLVRERQHMDAILELATVYEQTGKFEHARGLLQRAAKLRPNDPGIQARNKKIDYALSSALHEQVDSLIAREQFNLALPKLSMLLTLEPNNPLLHYKKAFCHLKLDNPQSAIQVIDDALALQKDEAFYKLRSDAVEAEKNLLVLDYVKKAINLMKTGSPADNQEALQYVGMILQTDPDHEWGKNAFIRLTGGETAPQPMDAAKVAAEPAAGPEDTMTLSGRLNQAGDDIKGAFGNVRKYLVTILTGLAALAILILVGVGLKRWIFTQDPPLTGKLSHFKLHDILNLLNMTARTGLVKVRAKTIRGDIHLESGEARHCRAGREEGTRALEKLLAKAKNGHFMFIETGPSFKKTIDVPLSLLLIGDYNNKPSRLKSPKKPKSRMKELLDSRK